ncbi:PREDICTED: leucine-rich repeat-containing protein 38 [Gekko japonicus]|uniref:Leucine-rich repeat-containing protein 38 n=1 Tax=Gekko japonicus TaxID=146911 RepID=A0ABM1JK33_GEKJA|nr:PREDICTED: leucine-rich repeat-containing protein 38 [Gekko japonicus]
MRPWLPLGSLPPLLLVASLSFPLGHFCPAVCSCLDYHTVDCRDQGLPGVPSPFPLDVRKVLIADNHIRAIPADFFIFYGDLVYLDFSHNAIVSLEEGTFSSSGKLVFLDLSHNNLTRLAAGAFKSAARLIKLSLGNNRLLEVDEAAFESLEQLQVLELNNNSLQTLTVATLDALPNLRSLRLEGNPWLCDCDFASLFSWLQENQSKLQKGLNEIQCSVPMEDRKIFLSELSEGSFRDCKFNLSLTDLIIIIFSGVAVSIAAIVSSFILALIVNCFHRCAPSKDDDEDEDSED